MKAPKVLILALKHKCGLASIEAIAAKFETIRDHNVGNYGGPQYQS